MKVNIRTRCAENEVTQTIEKWNTWRNLYNRTSKSVTIDLELDLEVYKTSKTLPPSEATLEFNKENGRG